MKGWDNKIGPSWLPDELMPFKGIVRLMPRWAGRMWHEEEHRLHFAVGRSTNLNEAPRPKGRGI